MSKRKSSFSIFYCISEMCMKFRTFWKKRRVSYPNYYRNYCIRKRCLLKRVKRLASAHHLVINVLTSSKHCWRQHRTTIFLFFHEVEINWVGKCLPWSHLKSSDCFLTRWLPMTSSPVAISRFSNNNFKRLYLKKGMAFFQFFIAFLKCAWNLEHSWKKEEYRSLINTEIIATC